MTRLSKSGVVPIKTAATILGVDVQTLRLMLREGLLDFGMAYKRPGSQKYSYLIFAEPFQRLTGYRAESEVQGA